ncbi:MAG: SRPBCC domain-containing protein [Bryobacteraceae bacterium]|jgi:uncharacterized protein YndB with AHSA1/START domain
MKAALILALAISALALAEVADSSNSGFTIRITIAIQAPPGDVYRRLVHNIGDWWDPAHTWTGDSHNLTIEEKPMGCFCEKLPANGGVRHMEVVNLAPGKTLVMSGALGPLQSMAAAATMTIQLTPADGATKLAVTYAVAGYLPAGMNTLAAPVDEVLTGQFTRLKNYIERNDPAPR